MVFNCHFIKKKNMVRVYFPWLPKFQKILHSCSKQTKQARQQKSTVVHLTEFFSNVKHPNQQFIKDPRSPGTDPQDHQKSKEHFSQMQWYAPLISDSGGGAKRSSLSSRPAQSTELVPGQSGLNCPKKTSGITKHIFVSTFWKLKRKNIYVVRNCYPLK